MFSKILIANRGEIACRVIRTARKLGMATVAVYSDADRHALHVEMADEAVHIGPAPARESYLRIDKIIDAATRTGAQAIHPGYGFLSENADFCRACDQAGIVFIGPNIKAIEAMGSKSAAKTIMAEAGVPLVPGYHGSDQTDSLLRAEADAMGYPVLLKAAAGGGGKGMRQVWAGADFDQALAAARREAMSSFGDDVMLVEKYLTQPRHVEIQVFCDSQGGAVYLHERDCSLQRRHQKVIEEAPAPGVDAALRRAMGEAAVAAAKAIDYLGAGTVEFLLDADGTFYFMEMNTRLQVEHPVTEMITGVDLVDWQLRVAAGQSLPLLQQQIPLQGHAFEARIYAEDPANDFLPAAGGLSYLRPPSASDYVRVDTGVRQGDEVSSFYDPMIAKLIVWDENRERALQRLATALSEYRIAGLSNNIEFLYNLATHPAFKAAELDTGFIERHQAQLFRDESTQLQHDLPLAAVAVLLARRQQVLASAAGSDSPWAQADAWRLNEQHLHHIELQIGAQIHAVAIAEPSSGRFVVGSELGEQSLDAELHNEELAINRDGLMQRHSLCRYAGADANHYCIYTAAGAIHFSVPLPDFGGDQLAGGGGMTAPMNGTVVAVMCEPGQRVAAGETLLVMEAMKMEHAIKAPADGVVGELFYAVGDLVEGGVELLSFEVAGQ